jgi:diacylglycerol kinase (ATP)
VERILLVANASAGTLEQEALETALGVLRPRGDVEVAETGSPDELDAVFQRLEGRDVVVAGGDGSLHAVVNALHRAGALDRTRVGLVPLGTGNDFARGVGIPLEPDEAAGLVVSGMTRRADLILDDAGGVVVNNLHLGVGAQASRAATAWKPRLGRLGYVVGAVSAGLRPEYVRVRVVVDGVELVRRVRVAQVAIGNGSHVGGGTELVPGADPASGSLVVIVSRTRSLATRLAYVARLRLGQHHRMKEVTRVRGREVTVEGDAFWVSADGEISGPFRSRTWRLEAGALEMFLPNPVAADPPPDDPPPPASEGAAAL